MNTNNLKRFAQETRIRLLKAVADKLEYVLNQDTVYLRDYAISVEDLNKDLTRMGKEALIDKVAYTWFNRLMALRFMDANDYQPLRLMVISPKEGFTQPEILDEAMQGHISDELLVDRKRIYHLLDGKIISNNSQNEIYRMLLIASCNYLHSLLPFLFEEIIDYTELLLPDDLISELSIINDFVQGMTTEDCQEVEIMGWLYQFYISDRKDEVFAAKGQVSKEDIPAATQLFTPKWIVEYMVQNTVGKLWLQNNPHSSLRDKMPYYIETEASTTDDYLKINSPEELTLLDQACGSGHILVYGFELLYHIYEEAGYTPSQIPQLIIKNNLYGYEIDERAAQLASFSVLMKARSYYRRLFRKPMQPNILCFQDLELSEEEIENVFEILEQKLTDKLKNDLQLMQQATNLGSLIQPCSSREELSRLEPFLAITYMSLDLFVQHNIDQLYSAVKQLRQLSQKFCCVVDNPPYMGDSKFNIDLADYINREYTDERLDLMTCFISSGLNSLKPKGLLGMINQQTWMFVSSYKNLRKKIIENYFLESMLHLGPRTFPEIGGEVVQNTSFVLKNKYLQNDSIFYRLNQFNRPDDKRRGFLKLKEKRKFYKQSLVLLSKVPNYNFSYWFSSKQIQSFDNERIKKHFQPKAGIVSGNDSKFLRFWSEVDNNDISYTETHFSNDVIWTPICKGGTTRKFFGNEEFIINLKKIWTEGETGVSVRRGDKEFYFKEAVTWTMVCGTSFSFRYSKNTTFSTASPALFNDNHGYVLYALGFLNSIVSQSFLPGINPTMNLGSGDVSRLPFIYNQKQKEECIRLTSDSISTSRLEWNSRETSWDFLQNELIRFNGQDIEEAIDLYKMYWTKQFYQLHRNEEELNKEFIHIYGLEEELTPDVSLEDITLLKDELVQRELKKLSTDYLSGWELDDDNNWILNNQREYPQLPFDEKELVQQFISYAVGCMMGRYSIHKEGLILANQGDDAETYFEKVGSADSLQFRLDKDGVIPVLDAEWFEDDIVRQFRKFVKVVWGNQNLKRNMEYIEKALGKPVRTYFYRDFYKDHVRRYKKRPIYWMIASPKGSFQALIYLHRYTTDTLSHLLNGYLRPYISKLENKKEHLNHTAVEGSAREQTKAKKEIARLEKVIAELRTFDREVIYPLATERISIDLDDGVLVNYNKLGAAVKTVAGLNNAAAKKRVKKFDWIDVEEIR